jgi:hypothetical protein
MTRLPTLFLALGCLFVLSPAFTPLNAQVKEICDNGIDDDGDKLVDCDDPDCVCTPKEICDNGIDDDGDKLVDCDDPDCVCTPKEICDNGIDDDGDKLVDCDDPDCVCVPEGVACSPGFWKNHTELWFGICCTGAQCDSLLADLKSRGPGSDVRRQSAADFLEACLGRPCNETGDDEEESKAVGDAVRDLNQLFCSSHVAPVIESADENHELRPVDVTLTVDNLKTVFQDA